LNFELYPLSNALQIGKYIRIFKHSMRIRDIFAVLVLGLFLQHVTSDSNYCCLTPDFGSGWCHSSSCLGSGCRNEPDPITGESQSNYQCDDLSNCLCSGAVLTHQKYYIGYSFNLLTPYRNVENILKYVILYRQEELQQCQNWVILFFPLVFQL
jgi:hypothetical protein